MRKAVIPAAGYGTRFLPVTKVVPKELLPIGNKPAIQYVVEEAVASGIEEIIFVCHPSKWSIVDYFEPDPALKNYLEKRGKRKELEELGRIESLAKFSVVTQEEPLGLGDAVLCAQKAVGAEPFVVLLADVIVDSEIPACRQLMEACPDESDWGLLIERIPNEKVSSYGIIRGKETLDGIYEIEEAVEKPRPEEAPSDLAILGRYFFTPEIFEEIEKQEKGALGEIQLTDGINQMSRRRAGKGILCEERIFDVGTPEGLLKAAQRLFFPSPHIKSLPGPFERKLARR